MFKKLAVGVVCLSLGMSVAVARPHHHNHHRHHHNHHGYHALIVGAGLVTSYMLYNNYRRYSNPYSQPYLQPYSYQEAQLKADRERLLLQQYDNELARERMESKRLHMEEMRLDIELEKMRQKEYDYPKSPY